MKHKLASRQGRKKQRAAVTVFLLALIARRHKHLTPLTPKFPDYSSTVMKCMMGKDDKRETGGCEHTLECVA